VSIVLPQLDMSVTKRCIWIFGTARIVRIAITVIPEVLMLILSALSQMMY